MASAKSRRGTLAAAMNNFDYVLSHASPGFYLRSEILMNRGIAQAMLQNPGAAIGDLLKAIEMDPKQPRAYVALADVYEKMKSRDKALTAVVAGLRHNPGTTSLQRRYTELGGKLPYPAPIAAAPAEQTAAVDAPAAPAAADQSDAAPAADAPVADAVEPPKIGSPTNPYCRFCPD